MRTSERAYQQIVWDPRLAPERFVIGIDEHRDKPKRIALPDFVPGGDVPWHRVLFIELDGRKVWDRATHTDVLDRLAAERTALPRPMKGWRDRRPVRFTHKWEPDFRGDPAPSDLTIVVWNVLWDRHLGPHIASEQRWERLIDTLLEHDPHLIALQEIDPALHGQILAHPEVRARYWVSHGPEHHDIGRYDLLWLGRVAIDQLAHYPLGPNKTLLGIAVGGAVCINLHLTSDHSPSAQTTRERQIETLRELALQIPGPLVVLGDFNTEGPLDLLDDAALRLGMPDPTFEPSRNPLAAMGTEKPHPRRLDRVLVRGLHPHELHRLGTEPVDGHWISDHYGLSVTLSAQPPPGVCEGKPSVRSALAWIAGDGGIQAIREVHDPAFHRWPPHVNLLWGFVEEHQSDAIEVLESALRDREPFDVALCERGTFTHRNDTSHHLMGTESGWESLHTALSRAFPACAVRPYTPHLTYARSEADEVPAAPPVTGRVDRLAWLTRRGGEPFEVRAWAHLGGVVTPVDEPVWPPGQPTAIPTAFLHSRATVVGSRMLDCALDGADVDLLWDGALDEAAAFFTEGGATVVRVEKNGLDGLRVHAGPLTFDILPRSEPIAWSGWTDAKAILTATASHRETFIKLARSVKAWARAQSLDDPAFGGVEGLALAVLVARTVLEHGNEAGEHAFFAQWASWDWSLGVGLHEAPPAPAVHTPTAPIRPINTRTDGPRFEAALLDAWALLDAGAPVEELHRPLPFHRRFPLALFIRAEDDDARARARGRARALLERVRATPMPGNPFVLGLENEDDATIRDAESWARTVSGVWVDIGPSWQAPTPGRVRP